MKKSGLADSPFFTQPQGETSTPLPPQVEFPVPENETVDTSLPNSEKTEETTQGQENENQAQKRTNVQSYVRTNERTDTFRVLKPKRQKIRHAFDIFEDQLRDLQMMQFEAVQKGKKKPKLGKMVQEAIDQYLKKSSLKTSRG